MICAGDALPCHPGCAGPDSKEIYYQVFFCLKKGGDDMAVFRVEKTKRFTDLSLRSTVYRFVQCQLIHFSYHFVPLHDHPLGQKHTKYHGISPLFRARISKLLANNALFFNASRGVLKFLLANGGKNGQTRYFRHVENIHRQ